MSLYGMIFGDPCIIKGCVYPYGHDGRHSNLSEFELTIVAPDDGLCAQAAGATVVYTDRVEAETAAERWRLKGITATVREIPSTEASEES